MTIQPYDWQEPAIDAGIRALDTYGTFINASEMGTGKTLVSLFTAKRLGRALAIVCPKSVVPDWEEWGSRIGVPVTAFSYGKVRTGKTPFGHWQMRTKDVKYFKWDLPPNALLIFDEVHECAGLDTQQAELLCAAKRQKYRLLLLSGTLAESPLKLRAIGYAAGLHQLVDFWPWAMRNGVVYVPRKVFTKGRQITVQAPEWPYLLPHTRSVGERIMEGIREALERRFYRIRKDQVPGFPEKQIVTLLLPTKKLDTSAFESGEYGYEARMASELSKVPGLVERARDQLSLGNSVALFVNYLDSLNALREEFPDASYICGGQSTQERVTNLTRFQENEAHVILVITAAGGTGVSLHDLHGRPRVTYLCPGDSASRFLQAIDRIHRAGALSHATIYVAFAAGVRVERRARDRMEAKLGNLSALNDSDLLGYDAPEHVTNLNPNTAHALVNDTDPAHAAHAAGVLPESSGTPESEWTEPSHEPLGGGRGQPHQPGPERASVHPLHDAGDGGTPGPDCDAGGPGRDADAHRPSGERPQGEAPAGSGEAQDRGAPPADPHLDVGRTGNMVRIAAPKGWAVVEKPSATPKTEVILAAPATLAQKEADATGNHVVRKHARCSPSKLKNLELCPSYEGDNDGPVHPVTLRGTAMHEALETGNDSGLLTENDNEELRLVTVCREFQEAEAVPGETVITEPHLRTHDPDVQGFADRVVLEPAVVPQFPNDGKTYVGTITRKARIRDYKMGWNPVDEPQDNPQAIAYTVAVFIAYPDVTHVDFAFLIPRLDLVLQHTFTRDDLPGLKLRLSTIAERVRKLAGQEFNVVDTNCLYCGRKATCQALHAKVLPLARGYHDVIESQLPLPATFNPTELTDPVQVAFGLNLAAILEGWIEQMRKRATEFRRDNGVEIPGYDWIERSAPRVVTNPVGAYEIATKEFGVAPEAFLSATKISVTQLSAVVADAAPKGEKAKAEERLTDRLMDTMALTRGASYFVLQRSKKKKLKDAA